MKYKTLLNPLAQVMKIIVFVVIVLTNIGLFVRIDMLFSDLPRYITYIAKSGVNRTEIPEQIAHLWRGKNNWLILKYGMLRP